ncbi:MAG: (2Fe-2S)-binding protein [Deltaproteobacteria bacterium]|nr:(2Fe-2S)-binding protein [Deltaproteobacteria bacterium]
MKAVKLTIDGRSVSADEGTSVFEAAKSVGIEIPSLCYHEKLEPFGACRLCMVEVSKNGRKRLVASCAYPVQEGLVVETKTEKVKRIRKVLIELLWPAAQKYAAEYGVTGTRFRTENTDCNLCGICVRYCAEVKKVHAVYFKGRGIEREIALVPDMGRECLYCRECFAFCTGGKILNEMDRLYS